MSAVVAWRNAERRDRAALERFSCTSPAPQLPSGRPLPHPRPWELEVQKWIRQHKPPGASDEIYRIGEDADGNILAVSIAGTIDVAEGLTFKLLVLAVAQSVRGQGGQVADDCLTDALRHMEAWARQLKVGQFLVLGMVDPRNVASQRMCDRNGFVVVGREDGYELWVRLVAVDPAP